MWCEVMGRYLHGPGEEAGPGLPTAAGLCGRAGLGAEKGSGRSSLLGLCVSSSPT